MGEHRPLTRTPKPGIEVLGAQKQPIIEAFCARYRTPGAGATLIWNTWHRPGGVPYRLLGIAEMGQLDLQIFSVPPLSGFDQLLVYFETPQELYEASPAQIRDYLAKRETWDDFDLYVFPQGMEWCVALTHDSNGIGVFLAGEASKWDVPLI